MLKLPKGAVYQINDIAISPPDEQTWSDVVQGNDLNGLPVISPYKKMQIQQQVGNQCNMDWFEYKGTVLDSITCPPPDMIDAHQRYKGAICQTVYSRHRQGVAQEIVAVFLIDTSVANMTFTEEIP